MRKLAIILIAALLLGAAASAEGILPVLQTPVPEITETVSYHYFMNYKAPTASRNSEGGYTYTYEADYAHYLSFGRALTQEGYALTGVELTDDGSGAITARVEKPGYTPLTIRYNQDKRLLSVAYSPIAEAMDADSEHPYEIDEAQASALPELAQIISLHAVTWVSRPSGDYVERLSEGGYRYHYTYVPYDAYRRFSVKLGEEGFWLVSSGKTEDGLDEAVVSDGEVELTIRYNQQSKDAYVSYPAFAHARDRVIFDDFDVVRDGESFPLGDNITATVTGWECVDRFHNQYNGTDYESGNGRQLVVILMDIDYRRPTGTTYGNLINFGTLYAEGDHERICFGRLIQSEPYYKIQRYYDELTGKSHFTAAIALSLTEAQAADPQGVALTFGGMDNYVPYVYFLQPPEDQ